MNTCSNCKWWNQERALMVHNEFTGMDVILAHCEPERHIGNQHPEKAVQRHHCGLTVDDYSCGEHKERE